MVVGDTVRNPGRSGIQTVVRSLAAAFGAQDAPVRLVVWKANSRHLRPLPPEYSAGLGAEPLARSAWHTALAYCGRRSRGCRGFSAAAGLHQTPVHFGIPAIIGPCAARGSCCRS